MEALECIFNRKSVRKFSDKDVTEGQIQTLLKAAMAAPTGKNTQPWEFVVIHDRRTLDAMAEELPYAKMLSGVKAAIVVCGDADKSSYWYIDCSAAAQNLLLAAESMGLGAVWTAAYPYAERMAVCRKYAALPDHIHPLCVIPVGYPSKDYSPREKFDIAKIHIEKY